MTRTFTRRVWSPPRRLNVPSCSTRKSLACTSTGISPISSRNKVPPSASSKCPGLRCSAPVKAPFSYPKSSASRRVAGMAAAFSTIKGCLARGLRRCTRPAMSSFPVPLSPVSKTVAGDGATCCTIWYTRFQVGLEPITLARATWSTTWRLRTRFSIDRTRRARAFCTVLSRSSPLIGLTRQSYAPSFMVATAVVISSWLDIITVAMLASCACTCRSTASPSMVGMLTAHSSTSTAWCSRWASASSPEAAVSTVYPSRLRSASRARRRLWASSTTKMLAMRVCPPCHCVGRGPPG